MKRFGTGIGITLCLLFAMTACKLPCINWQSHVSFRVSKKNLSIAEIDPKEKLEACVSKDLHYVTIALDTVFFRDLPGFFGNSVVFGFEISGVLPNGEPIKTVLDVSEVAREHAFMSFDNVAVIEPFLYSGQNITITLHFEVVGSKEKDNIKGRVDGCQMCKKLDPMNFTPIKQALNIFNTIVGIFRPKPIKYKYTFSLYPCDSVYRDKPDRLFTATRHILLSIPPADAPPKYKHLKPHLLMPKLKMRGNRLIYKKTGEEYYDTPYLILNITRFKRYPKETEIAKLEKKIDNFIERGNLEAAKTNLANLAVAINEDKVITQEEKNLARSLKDWRETKIKILVAKKGGDPDAMKRLIKKEVGILKGVLKDFKNMLYPFEVKKFNYRLARQGRRLNGN